MSRAIGADNVYYKLDFGQKLERSRVSESPIPGFWRRRFRAFIAQNSSEPRCEHGFDFLPKLRVDLV
ncbi:MAG: hypothetical protein ACOCX1_04135, partial [Fimbriimonadaceae bacterium]